MAIERLQGEEQFHSKNYLLEIPCSHAKMRLNPANTLRKSSVILRLYFGNLRKLLSANVDVT